MSADLVVVELAGDSAALTQCAVKCVRGTLRVGDSLKTALDDTRVLDVDLEVVEIARYEGVLVHELEENFGALVHLAGNWPAPVGVGWSLRTAPSSGGLRNDLSLPA